MSNNYNYYYFSFFHYFGFEARSELPIIRYVYRRFQSHREVPFIPILTRNEIKSRRERNSFPNSLSLSLQDSNQGRRFRDPTWLDYPKFILTAPLMAQLVKAGESVSVVIFLGCCAFAKIDRHANESNVRPLLAQPSPRDPPLLSSPPFLLPLISGRCSPRGERMIGWRCNSCYAFLPRPTRPDNVYLFIRCTRHPGVVG